MGFFSCGERGYSLVVLCRPLIAVASLAAKCRLSDAGVSVLVACRLNSCSSRAPELGFVRCGPPAESLGHEGSS